MPKPRICTIPDCGKLRRCRGYCESHYRRWLDHGDPLAGRTEQGRTHPFLRDVVLTHESDDCLLWPFALFSTGYGLITINGQSHGVHRVVCEAVHGAPPSPTHEAAHSCGNKPCCNKQHLRWATPAENKADELIHGTRRRGEQHTLSKLTIDQVLRIRELADSRSMSQSTIAAMFGIDQTQVSNIYLRKQWTHL